MKRATTRLAVAALALLDFTSVLQAAPGTRMTAPRPAASAYLNPTRPGLAPFAYVRFCVANAEDCRVSGGEETVELTQAQKDLLKRINADVNRTIHPRYDTPSRDVWQVDVSAGDCEDYVLTKRRLLVAAGLPAASLRIALAYTAAREGHAVLVVRTDRGDLVLDNRFDRIKPWNATDLRILKIQSAKNPRIWYDL